MLFQRICFAFLGAGWLGLILCIGLESRSAADICGVVMLTAAALLIGSCMLREV